LPFGSLQNRRSMVSVWNLCDLIKCATLTPREASSVLMISDEESLSTPDLIRKLGHAMNRPVRLIPAPVSLLKLLGSVTGKSAEVSRLVGSLTVDIRETKRLLDWTPPVPVNEGLARTAQWFLNDFVKQRD
jgi:nucleoside-diphosphate-sugar epimerase